MEKIDLQFESADKALDTLKEILLEKNTKIVRDATIQRFEYTFEAIWKYLKEYLKIQEGIIANSPKSCFRELFSLGLISEKETVACLEMTDDRNNTVHVYHEKIAISIYKKIPAYVKTMITLLNTINP